MATSGPGVGDVFTETLTTVAAINRAVTDQIGLKLTGTVTDSGGSFMDVPITLNLTASESMGLIDVEFTNATTSVTPTIPEPSTWVMMALGFGALGYAGFRRRMGHAFGIRFRASVDRSRKAAFRAAFVLARR